jgi:hypothetical protein
MEPQKAYIRDMQASGQASAGGCQFKYYNSEYDQVGSWALAAAAADKDDDSEPPLTGQLGPCSGWAGLIGPAQCQQGRC